MTKRIESTKTNRNLTGIWEKLCHHDDFVDRGRCRNNKPKNSWKLFILATFYSWKIQIHVQAIALSSYLWQKLALPKRELCLKIFGILRSLSNSVTIFYLTVMWSQHSLTVARFIYVCFCLASTEIHRNDCLLTRTIFDSASNLLRCRFLSKR